MFDIKKASAQQIADEIVSRMRVKMAEAGLTDMVVLLDQHRAVIAKSLLPSTKALHKKIQAKHGSSSAVSYNASELSSMSDEDFLKLVQPYIDAAIKEVLGAA